RTPSGVGSGAAFRATFIGRAAARAAIHFLNDRSAEARTKKMATTTMLQRWTVADSLELYNVRSWGNAYFSINEKGNVAVLRPGAGDNGATPAIDMKELVDEV